MTLTQQIIWTLCILWVLYDVFDTVQYISRHPGRKLSIIALITLVLYPIALWLIYAIAYVWGWR